MPVILKENSNAFPVISPVRLAPATQAKNKDTDAAL